MKQASEIRDISYFDGWIYFVVSYFNGSKGCDSWICRMKKDGSSFEKLCEGRYPTVYDKHINYIEVIHQLTKEDYTTPCVQHYHQACLP